MRSRIGTSANCLAAPTSSTGALIAPTWARRSVVIISATVRPTVAASDVLAHPAATSTCAGSEIMCASASRVCASSCSGDSAAYIFRIASPWARTASGVAFGSMSAARYGSPSTLTTAPGTSGAAAATQSARNPPRLCPTMTGLFRRFSRMYCRMPSRTAFKKSQASRGGGPSAKPASVRT